MLHASDGRLWPGAQQVRVQVREGNSSQNWLSLPLPPRHIAGRSIASHKVCDVCPARLHTGKVLPTHISNQRSDGTPITWWGESMRRYVPGSQKHQPDNADQQHHAVRTQHNTPTQTTTCEQGAAHASDQDTTQASLNSTRHQGGTKRQGKPGPDAEKAGTPPTGHPDSTASAQRRKGGLRSLGPIVSH